MKLSVRLLGLDLFEFSLDTDHDNGEPGDATTNPVGYSLPDMPTAFPLLDREETP